jgi:hypothetical protein
MDTHAEDLTQHEAEILLAITKRARAVGHDALEAVQVRSTEIPAGAQTAPDPRSGESFARAAIARFTGLAWKTGTTKGREGRRVGFAKTFLNDATVIIYAGDVELLGEIAESIEPGVREFRRGGAKAAA